MPKIEFKTEIKIRDGNPYVDVSKEQAIRLKKDWIKPMPVIIQINNEPNPAWHINMMPDGKGNFYLYLHGDVRKTSKTKVGDVVSVKVQFDEDYKNGPMHPMPQWFENALNANTAAQKNWNNLAPSRQKEILRYFSRLKSEEAIDRNLEKAMHVLSGKPARFMARSWDNGK